MTESQLYAKVPGQLIIVGFGSIGQGTLPLILRHFDVPRDAITIISADSLGREIAEGYGISFVQKELTVDNFRDVLSPLLKSGSFLLNLSVNVSSVALIGLCQERNVLYLDTCIEPWDGGYTDPTVPPEQRTNYMLREGALALRKRYPKGPTAVLAHGANPGMVSHFVKKALLQIATDIFGEIATPRTRQEWGELLQRTGVKVIHIAERDTQVASVPKKRGEFVNTWSVKGFVGEGCQPAELGWGSHERHWPADGIKHTLGCGAAIYLNRPGASVRVRSWTPDEGPYHGFLITHNEAISIADYFTVRSGESVDFRPTVHYAYHPCDDAVKSVHELAGKNWQMPQRYRILLDEIIGGYDELGVLLMGHAKNAYWYGSYLSTERARELAPYNSATTLQVTSSVIAGMAWALRHPDRGIVEADEMDHHEVLEMALPYLGTVKGEYSDWTPLQQLHALFPVDVDKSDPWQFKNFLVV